LFTQHFYSPFFSPQHSHHVVGCDCGEFHVSL
jgi:hypothetical protein